MIGKGIRITAFTVLSAVIILNSISASAFPHDREKWIRDNYEGIVHAMCNKYNFFRMCFLIDDKLCERVAKVAVSRCMDEQRPYMKNPMDIPHDDKKFRPLIGACSGAQFEARLKPYRKNEDRCSLEEAATRIQSN